MAARRLSQICHKKVLHDVFLEHRVVNAFQKKKRSRKVIVLAFIIRLVKHFILHNIVLFISVFRASPEALGLLIPTIAVQYFIRILQSVLAQYKEGGQPIVGALANPEVFDCLQNDLIPIVEEVARFFNMPGVADSIETTAQCIAQMEETGEKVDVVVPAAAELAAFLGRTVVAKSAQTAVRRLSVPSGGVLVGTSPTAAPTDLISVAKNLAEVLGDPTVSGSIQSVAQDASTGVAIDHNRDVQPVVDGLRQLLRHPSVLNEIASALTQR